MGDELSVLDIAWFIYAFRLSLAGYPFERLHPHVWPGRRGSRARPEFAKEIAMRAARRSNSRRRAGRSRRRARRSKPSRDFSGTWRLARSLRDEREKTSLGIDFHVAAVGNGKRDVLVKACEHRQIGQAPRLAPGSDSPS